MSETEKNPDKETLNKWLQDSANYKRFLGIPIYYNAKDKRILPPRKVTCVGIGINSLGLLPPNGWAINFANPYSVLVMIGSILVPLAIIYCLVYFTN